MNGLLNYRLSDDDSCGWDNRYRPQTLEEVLLPCSLKKTLLSYRDQQAAPALLFYGSAGTGKTTTALAMNPDETFHFNASELDDRDLKSSAFDSALSAMSMYGKGRRKVFILDEADALTERAQMSLRSKIEQYSSNVWFIFIVNHLAKIIDPIRSRTTEIGFGFSEDTEEMEHLMVKRCVSILKKEKRSMPRDKVRELVGMYAPDMRRILNYLQYESTR